MFDPARWRESCAVVDCRWGCGARYHGCKAAEHSQLCKLFRQPEPQDWITRLQLEPSQQEEEEEEEGRGEARGHLLRGATRELPAPPASLLQPTYLAQDLETYHPMEVRPAGLHNFLCGGVFRRDELAWHQDLPPFTSLNSSKLVNIHSD